MLPQNLDQASPAAEFQIDTSRQDGGAAGAARARRTVARPVVVSSMNQAADPAQAMADARRRPREKVVDRQPAEQSVPSTPRKVDQKATKKHEEKLKRAYARLQSSASGAAGLPDNVQSTPESVQGSRKRVSVQSRSSVAGSRRIGAKYCGESNTVAEPLENEAQRAKIIMSHEQAFDDQAWPTQNEAKAMKLAGSDFDSHTKDIIVTFGVTITQCKPNFTSAKDLFMKGFVGTLSELWRQVGAAALIYPNSGFFGRLTQGEILHFGIMLVGRPGRALSAKGREKVVSCIKALWASVMSKIGVKVVPSDRSQISVVHVSPDLKWHDPDYARTQIAMLRGFGVRQWSSKIFNETNFVTYLSHMKHTLEYTVRTYINAYVQLGEEGSEKYTKAINLVAEMQVFKFAYQSLPASFCVGSDHWEQHLDTVPGLSCYFESVNPNRFPIGHIQDLDKWNNEYPFEVWAIVGAHDEFSAQHMVFDDTLNVFQIVTTSFIVSDKVTTGVTAFIDRKAKESNPDTEDIGSQWLRRYALHYNLLVMELRNAVQGRIFVEIRKRLVLWQNAISSNVQTLISTMLEKNLVALTAMMYDQEGKKIDDENERVVNFVEHILPQQGGLRYSLCLLMLEQTVNFCKQTRSLGTTHVSGINLVMELLPLFVSRSVQQSTSEQGDDRRKFLQDRISKLKTANEYDKVLDCCCYQINVIAADFETQYQRIKAVPRAGLRATSLHRSVSFLSMQRKEQTVAPMADMLPSVSMMLKGMSFCGAVTSTRAKGRGFSVNIQGLAGTGKTGTLGAARNHYNLYTVSVSNVAGMDKFTAAPTHDNSGFYCDECNFSTALSMNADKLKAHLSASDPYDRLLVEQKNMQTTSLAGGMFVALSGNAVPSSLIDILVKKDSIADRQNLYNIKIQPALEKSFFMNCTIPVRWSQADDVQNSSSKKGNLMGTPSGLENNIDEIVRAKGSYQTLASRNQDEYEHVMKMQLSSYEMVFAMGLSGFHGGSKHIFPTISKFFAYDSSGHETERAFARLCKTVDPVLHLALLSRRFLQKFPRILMNFGQIPLEAKEKTEFQFTTCGPLDAAAAAFEPWSWTHLARFKQYWQGICGELELRNQINIQGLVECFREIQALKYPDEPKFGLGADQKEQLGDVFDRSKHQYFYPALQHLEDKTHAGEMNFEIAARHMYHLAEGTSPRWQVEFEDPQNNPRGINVRSPLKLVDTADIFYYAIDRLLHAAGQRRQPRNFTSLLKRLNLKPDEAPDATPISHNKICKLLAFRLSQGCFVGSLMETAMMQQCVWAADKTQSFPHVDPGISDPMAQITRGPDLVERYWHIVGNYLLQEQREQEQRANRPQTQTLAGLYKACQGALDSAHDFWKSSEPDTCYAPHMPSEPLYRGLSLMDIFFATHSMAELMQWYVFTRNGVLQCAQISFDDQKTATYAGDNGPRFGPRPDVMNNHVSPTWDMDFQFVAIVDAMCSGVIRHDSRRSKDDYEVFSESWATNDSWRGYCGVVYDKLPRYHFDGRCQARSYLHADQMNICTYDLLLLFFSMYRRQQQAIFTLAKSFDFHPIPFMRVLGRLRQHLNVLKTQKEQFIGHPRLMTSREKEVFGEDYKSADKITHRNQDIEYYLRRDNIYRGMSLRDRESYFALKIPSLLQRDQLSLERQLQQMNEEERHVQRAPCYNQVQFLTVEQDDQSEQAAMKHPVLYDLTDFHLSKAYDHTQPQQEFQGPPPQDQGNQRQTQVKDSSQYQVWQQAQQKAEEFKRPAANVSLIDSYINQDIPRSLPLDMRADANSLQGRDAGHPYMSPMYHPSDEYQAFDAQLYEDGPYISQRYEFPHLSSNENEASFQGGWEMPMNMQDRQDREDGDKDRQQ